MQTVVGESEPHQHSGNAKHLLEMIRGRDRAPRAHEDRRRTESLAVRSGGDSDGGRDCVRCWQALRRVCSNRDLQGRRSDPCNVRTKQAINLLGILIGHETKIVGMTVLIPGPYSRRSNH
jgi:hypothetical protein